MKASGILASKLSNRLLDVFPDGINTTCLFEKGDDFLVIEVNQEWMFRFARHSGALKALQCEKGFLPEFERISPLPVPHIRYMEEDFIGYPKICGSLLTSELCATLEAGVRRRIARQIGAFLSALHTFPLDKARDLGLTEGWDGWRQKAYGRFKEQVAPRLSDQARRNAIAYLDQFLALQWDPVVIHGDFYPADHVFFDEKNQKICGVIDFGDLTIEDAAADFQSIFEDFGETFFHIVLESYSRQVDADFLERIKIRIKARPLFDASYSLEYGFEQRFRRRLENIEADFGKHEKPW